ncbi:hypothetical protein ACDL92_06185 [Ihubacter sp. mB4P-1]|uniref:hypothetical protein n=1 Tax=Ihubacter sp. mB4P-1 TaxID=3242370 RepID=UPI00137AEB5C
MSEEKACRTCRLKAFFEKEHTASEKAGMVAAALLVGLAAGILLSPVRNGIHIEASVGSHNGCNNRDCGVKK